MPEQIMRRANTDWYERHIERLIDKGQELTSQERLSFSSFDELMQRVSEIEEWLHDTDYKLENIYRPVPEGFNVPLITLILERLQFTEVARILREVIADRNNKLERLKVESRQYPTEEA